MGHPVWLPDGNKSVQENMKDFLLTHREFIDDMITKLSTTCTEVELSHILEDIDDVGFVFGDFTINGIEGVKEEIRMMKEESDHGPDGSH